MWYIIWGLVTNDNGSTTNYSWDYENRMITATLPNSDVSTYTYDGMGLRRKSETPSSITKFILDGQDVLLETNDGGTTQVVYSQTPDIYGIVLSQRRAGASSFYHYDVQGSVTELTNSVQIVTDTYRYYAFGKTLVSTGSTVNPYGYNGKVGYYSETGLGLQYLRNRWYNPTLGRFTSEDPIGDGNNWYSYVDDNPINFIDPDGYAKTQEIKLPDPNAPFTLKLFGIKSALKKLNFLKNTTLGLLFNLDATATIKPDYKCPEDGQLMKKIEVNANGTFSLFVETKLFSINVGKVNGVNGPTINFTIKLEEAVKYGVNLSADNCKTKKTCNGYTGTVTFSGTSTLSASFVGTPDLEIGDVKFKNLSLVGSIVTGFTETQVYKCGKVKSSYTTQHDGKIQLKFVAYYGITKKTPLGNITIYKDYDFVKDVIKPGTNPQSKKDQVFTDYFPK